MVDKLGPGFLMFDSPIFHCNGLAVDPVGSMLTDVHSALTALRLVQSYIQTWDDLYYSLSCSDSGFAGVLVMALKCLVEARGRYEPKGPAIF